MARFILALHLVRNIPDSLKRAHARSVFFLLPQLTKHIAIENPAPGGARFTSRRCAERYVAKGRARFVRPNRIRFIESDYRNESAHRLSVSTDWGYDGRGRMRLDEIKRIPCLKPVELITIPRKRSVSLPRNGKVKSLAHKKGEALH